MKKRLLALTMAMIMVASTMVACGGNETPAATDETTTEEGGETTGDAEAPVEGDAEAPAPTPEEQMQQFAGQLVQMLLEQVGDPALVSQILQMALDMVSQAAPAQPGFARMGGRLVRIK